MPTPPQKGFLPTFCGGVEASVAVIAASAKMLVELGFDLVGLM